MSQRLQSDVLQMICREVARENPFPYPGISHRIGQHHAVTAASPYDSNSMIPVTGLKGQCPTEECRLWPRAPDLDAKEYGTVKKPT